MAFCRNPEISERAFFDALVGSLPGKGLYVHVVMARRPGGAGEGRGSQQHRKEINMKAAAAPRPSQPPEGRMCCTTSGPGGGVDCRTLRGVGYVVWGERESIYLSDKITV